MQHTKDGKRNTNVEEQEKQSLDVGVAGFQCDVQCLGVQKRFVAQQIEKSVTTVERAVAKLKKQGRLAFIGPKKDGRWEVIIDTNK